MTLLFSAGEASGDAYAVALVNELNALGAKFEDVAGIVGPRGARSIRQLADSSKWGALGIIEALRVAPRIIWAARGIRSMLRQGPPGIFVPIDFGYLNVHLAKVAKQGGWKVVYFSPPGSWRRHNQGKDLPLVTDEIITPFSWSADLLNAAGASAHWFGHPLLQMIGPPTDVERNTIAALPGSRMHEIVHTLPLFAEVSREVDLPFEFAVSPTLGVEVMRRQWLSLGGTPNATFTVGDTYGVLRRAKAGLICSGTATLESMLCDCPCVVTYRGSKMMEIEYKIRKPKFDAFALPNILLQRHAIPELIQWDAVKDIVLGYLRPLLVDSPERKAQLDAIAELRGLLGPSDAITKSAQLIAACAARSASRTPRML